MRKLDIVPWGRSLEEYIKMFNLTSQELNLSILDCGGGPSSFNAEMTNAGHKVISCDPIYQFTDEEIGRRIQETYPVIIKAAQDNKDKFVWRDIGSPEQLGKLRMASMQKFLEDFHQARGRYLTDELPNLSFANKQFDLALCSHLLFTYSEQLSLEFHLASILEMYRVATEVRVFPLLTNFIGEVSPYLQPVMSQLAAYGYQVEIKQVSYEFQRNGNQFLQLI